MVWPAALSPVMVKHGEAQHPNRLEKWRKWLRSSRVKSRHMKVSDPIWSHEIPKMAIKHSSGNSPKLYYRWVSYLNGHGKCGFPLPCEKLPEGIGSKDQCPTPRNKAWYFRVSKMTSPPSAWNVVFTSFHHPAITSILVNYNNSLTWNKVK